MPGKITRPSLSTRPRPWLKISIAGWRIDRSGPDALPCPSARSSGLAGGPRRPGSCSWSSPRPYLRRAGIVFATRLKSDIARTGQALLAEKEKRRTVEKEFVEERQRKLRAEEDQYFQAIVAADQALTAKDPVAAERSAGGLPAPAAELGVATSEPAVSIASC